MNELRVIFKDISKMIEETNKYIKQINKQFNVVFNVQMPEYEKIEDKMEEIRKRINKEFSYEKKHREQKKEMMPNVIMKPHINRGSYPGIISENKKVLNQITSELLIFQGRL